MKSRCLNPKHPAYNRYGGAGIGVCKEWMSFKAFESWALSNGYSGDLTIDRINPDGNYEPGNCQWLTLQENSGKRRRRTKAQIMHDNLMMGIIE
jgi:hypothetical protein